MSKGKRCAKSGIKKQREKPERIRDKARSSRVVRLCKSDGEGAQQHYSKHHCAVMCRGWRLDLRGLCPV
jgi:hypothetical protein